MTRIRCSLVFNIAPLYRKSIYKLINEQLDCEWIFGKNETDIASCSDNIFSKVDFLETKHGKKNTYWLKGAVRQVFRKNSPENIIMLGEPKFMTSWLILLKNKLLPKKRKKKIIIWAHGWYGNETAIQNFAYKIYFGMADKVMFYGDRSKGIAISNGLNPKKLLVIHNSLDHEEFQKIKNSLSQQNLKKEIIFKNLFFKPSLPLMFYIGRLSEIKKIHLVLEAMSLLKRKGKEYNFLIIGMGRAYDSLKNKVKLLGLENNVYFYGEAYNDEETAPLIYLSDLCVSPGHIGLTAIHSIELGVPVITHNDFTRQAPEVEAIIPGKTGNFFEKDNILDLADKIEKTIIKSYTLNDKHYSAYCDKVIKNWTPDYQIKIINQALV